MSYTPPSSDISAKQSEINKLLLQYEQKRSLVQSLVFLFKDLLFNVSFFLIYVSLINNYNFCLPMQILLHVFYSIVQGTLLIGLWVIAHECGHHAFSPYKKINNIIGFILHEFLLVPYFSWQYSHGKHHKYTNHLVYGETHVPFTKNDLFIYL
jgi:omega-6 fatty acid desaturase (delta-12 desaturase)